MELLWLKGTVNPEKCRLGVLCLLHIAPGVPTEPQDSKKYSQKQTTKKSICSIQDPALQATEPESSWSGQRRHLFTWIFWRVLSLSQGGLEKWIWGLLARNKPEWCDKDTAAAATDAGTDLLPLWPKKFILGVTATASRETCCDLSVLGSPIPIPIPQIQGWCVWLKGFHSQALKTF